MILYLILALILWFVVPLLIEGHVRKKTDRKSLVNVVSYCCYNIGYIGHV